MMTYQPDGTSSFRPTSLTIDTQKYYRDDEGFLDENLMDSSLDMSPPTTDGSRRESYAVFSPKSQVWTPTETQHALSNSNTFVTTEGTDFLMPEQNAFTVQQQPWGMNDGVLAQGLVHFNGLPVDLRNTAFRPIQVQTSFSNTGDHVALFSPSNTTQAAISSSPQDIWGVPDDLEDRASKRLRMASPGATVHSPLLRRGDGIRKKNARFDIPAGRTLINIDRLISESSDDQEIKELKQQKRLLRNRQAALDSRQRKKQHTERLEDEKKQFTGLVQDLEKDLIDSQHREDELRYQVLEYQRSHHQMQVEREDMCRSHAQETSALRQKIDLLMESVHRPITPALSLTNFVLQDYNTHTAETWDMFGQESSIKPEVAQTPLEIVTDKREGTDSQACPTQGTLLAILLLGALVTRQDLLPGVPRMPDHVCSAAAVILEDVSNFARTKRNHTEMASSVSQPLAEGSLIVNNSCASWPASSTHAHQNSSDTLHHFTSTTTMPSEKNNHEQIFIDPATQYNSLSHISYLVTTPNYLLQPTSQNLKVIAATFDALQQQQHQNDKQREDGAFEHSFLWNQVAPDIVGEFTHLAG